MVNFFIDSVNLNDPLTISIKVNVVKVNAVKVNAVKVNGGALTLTNMVNGGALTLTNMVNEPESFVNHLCGK